MARLKTAKEEIKVFKVCRVKKLLEDQYRVYPEYHNQPSYADVLDDGSFKITNEIVDSKIIKERDEDGGSHGLEWVCNKALHSYSTDMVVNSYMREGYRCAISLRYKNGYHDSHDAYINEDKMFDHVIMECVIPVGA